MNSDAYKRIQTYVLLHRVAGVFMALMSCFFLPHLIIGLMFLVDPQAMQGPNQQAAFPFSGRMMGVMFFVFPAIMVTMNLIIGTTVFISGSRIRDLRSYNFCLISACLALFGMPVGTVIGAFSIYTLVQPEVRELFSDTKDNEMRNAPSSMDTHDANKENQS